MWNILICQYKKKIMIPVIFYLNDKHLAVSVKGMKTYAVDCIIYQQCWVD